MIRIPNVPRVLSHQWPPMAAQASDLVGLQLRAGCTCAPRTATLRRRIIECTISVALQCDGCHRDMTGPMPRDWHPYWQAYPEFVDPARSRIAAPEGSSAKAAPRVGPKPAPPPPLNGRWC